MAKKASSQMPGDWLDRLNDDDLFDELLFTSLKPVSPPEDFSTRVMAAIENIDTPDNAGTNAPVRVITFPWRRFAAGLGTCAAALALFVGVSATHVDDNPATLLQDKPVQLAEITPAITAPTQKSAQSQEVSLPQQLNNPTTVGTQDMPVANGKSEAVADNATTGNSIGNAADNNVNSQDNANITPSGETTLPVESNQLVLPRVAYGTETEGTMSTRLLATIEGNKVYQPCFTGKSVVFNTTDSTNLYYWQVDLTNPSEPHMAAMSAQADLPDISELLQNTTAPVNATTVVTSPDKTMLAQNSADGLWISLLEGEVFQLTANANGKLLAWSPDSAKLVFTNADGTLFVGYPLERRVYKLTDSAVQDVCWSSDSKTLVYVCNSSDNGTLYIVETY